MTVQDVKQKFFAYRNGIVADALRKASDRHSIIFGLNLPQLAEIAQMTGKDATLARTLWQDGKVRESQLLAPYIMPTEDFVQEEAMEWIKEAPNHEVTDLLCMKLLRNLPYALELLASLEQSDSEPTEHIRYTAMRLRKNLEAIGKLPTPTINDNNLF